jgi:putative transposase
MAKPSWVATGGQVVHVMNRATQGQLLITCGTDFRIFECTLQQARTKYQMRILACCVMPNHYHLVVWPRADGDLPRFMHWFGSMLARRLHASRGTTGRGAIFQGRYRGVLARDEAAIYRLLRYVERNPVRANLVVRPDEWPWSTASANATTRIWADAWPVPRPAGWVSLLVSVEPQDELDHVRTCVALGVDIVVETPAEAAPAGSTSTGSVEDDRLVGRDKDAVVEVPADGSRQHHLFDVSTLRDQVVDLVAMRDPRDILLDDRALVEDVGHVVSRGADQLDPAVEGGVIRPGPGECRQERVMDVDDLPRIASDERRRQHLHVARKDDQLDVVLPE